MHDRLGLIAARMALSPREGLHEADALRDLRLGRNIIHLRRVQVAAAAPALQQRLRTLAEQISSFYAARAARGWAAEPPAALLSLIDDAISHLGEATPGETRRHGFLALTGIRRNLFPDAPAYEAREAA